jgi:hypothetical protein
MKKWMCAVALCLLCTASAHAQKLGVGAFAGVNIPLVQDDAESGALWGIRGQIQAVPMFRIEPRLSFVKNGEYQLDGIGGTYDLDGGKLTGWGVDVVLGSPMSVPGLGVGLVAGIGSYKRQVDFQEDDTRVGYSGGLDIGVGAGPIRLNGRGELLVIPGEDGGSRKHALLTVGAAFAFGAR